MIKRIIKPLFSYFTRASDITQMELNNRKTQPVSQENPFQCDAILSSDYNFGATVRLEHPKSGVSLIYQIVADKELSLSPNAVLISKLPDANVGEITIINEKGKQCKFEVISVRTAA